MKLNKLNIAVSYS